MASRIFRKLRCKTVTFMNKQFENYFLKALYNAKIEQITQTYKDFSCRTNVKIDDVQFDVIVQTPDKVIAFDIQVSPSQEKLKGVKKRHEKAKALDYNFRVVKINKPINPTIAIGWLNQALFKYLVNHPPEVIRSQPYHAHSSQVKTYINYIEINGLNALIQVDGGIYVDFQCGNDEDHLISETFPFEDQALG